MSNLKQRLKQKSKGNNCLVGESTEVSWNISPMCSCFIPMLGPKSVGFGTRRLPQVAGFFYLQGRNVCRKEAGANSTISRDEAYAVGGQDVRSGVYQVKNKFKRRVSFRFKFKCFATGRLSFHAGHYPPISPSALSSK